MPGSCTTHKRAWGIPQGVPVGVDVAEVHVYLEREDRGVVR